MIKISKTKNIYLNYKVAVSVAISSLIQFIHIQGISCTTIVFLRLPFWQASRARENQPWSA